MVVFLPVGRHFGEQVRVPGLNELFMPLLSKLGRRLGRSLKGHVVVHVVSGRDEEIRSHVEDRGQSGIPEGLVRTVIGVLKSVVPHAGDDHEADFARHLRAVERLERTRGAGSDEIPIRAVDQAVVVPGPRIQAVDLRLHDMIVARCRPHPVGFKGILKIGRGRQLEMCRSLRTGEISLDQLAPHRQS